MVDLRALAHQAVCTPSLDASAALDVLVDALLERREIAPLDRQMLVVDAPFHPLGYVFCPHLALRAEARDWALRLLTPPPEPGFKWEDEGDAFKVTWTVPVRMPKLPPRILIDSDDFGE